MEELIYFAKCAIAVFAIVNPVGILPLVLSLTADSPKAMQKSIIRRGTVTAFFVLLITAVAGEFIFSVFGITLGALRIAGGIFLFIIAVPMLYGEQSKTKFSRKEQEHAEQKEDPAITPVGIPLIAGPGAISTVMSLMEQSKTFTNKGIVILAIISALVISYPILKYGFSILNLLGENGIRVITRIMGLILAVIAVQFVINGLHDAVPQIMGK